MAGLDKPRLIFRNNLREDKHMMPRLHLTIVFGSWLCSEIKAFIFLWEKKSNCLNEHTRESIFVESDAHTV